MFSNFVKERKYHFKERRTVRRHYARSMRSLLFNFAFWSFRWSEITSRTTHLMSFQCLRQRIAQFNLRDGERSIMGALSFTLKCACIASAQWRNNCSNSRRRRNSPRPALSQNVFASLNQKRQNCSFSLQMLNSFFNLHFYYFFSRRCILARALGIVSPLIVSSSLESLAKIPPHTQQLVNNCVHLPHSPLFTISINRLTSELALVDCAEMMITKWR